jgi:ADP-ribosyl-[dinitrogen reductase] hydrolase
MDQRLIPVDAIHQVGEVRQENGLRSMCLGQRGYGGGSGTLWATPGETVEFTVQGGRTKGYLLGICQGIFPKRKSVSLLIVKGSTWGDFKTGNAIEIKAESIGRYNTVDRDIGITLSTLADEARSTTYANQVFKDLTLQELNEAFTEEFAATAKRFLGTRAYERSEAILTAYLSFAQNLRDNKSDLIRQPSKKILASARRVRTLLGLDGSQVGAADSDLIPSNLSPSQSAAYGAVIGALVGDAAGGVLELLGRTPTRNDVDRALNMPGGGAFGLAPGQITDDGELTLCLLRALAERDGVYDPSLVAEYYIDWANSAPFDIGMATSNALRVQGYQLHDPAAVVKRSAAQNNANSKANGALMRITPLAVASAKWSAEEAIHWARVDAAMTHAHVTCQAVNAAYVLAVRHLVLSPGDSDGAVNAAHSFLSGEHNEALEWLDEAIEGRLPNAHPQSGYVRIAFTYAFHHLCQRSSLRQALANTLLMGGDTDTNACIVGGLVGAYRGITKLMAAEVSRKLVFPVLMCDPSLGQARPEVYHASNLTKWMAVDK